MKILYLTWADQEDYLADNILYGLRMRLGKNLVDWPKKEMMYKNCQVPNDKLYGKGFTLYKTLDEIERPKTDALADMLQNKYDVVVFSDIYRMQGIFAHFTVFKYFESAHKTKFIFLDGSDDGFPTVYDAIKRGVYFKRDNPYKYPLNIIGLSIPKAKLLKEAPPKRRLVSTHVQCEEAFNYTWIKQNCTNQPIFTTEKDYYRDLAESKYGITMKKSGWDTPRHMENAANWVVNCIYTKGWDWDLVDFYNKDPLTHPIGFKDMENCILWSTAKELEEKIKSIEQNGNYNKVSRASHEWAKTKTCEKMADYILSYV